MSTQIENECNKISDAIEEDDNLEPQDDIFNERITAPFDPSKIRVQRREMTIDLLLVRIKHEEINLTPDFQRKAGLWKESAQSQLIESLLIRIPLPAFYMDATDDNKWLVVDGLQRLTTLSKFVLKEDLTLTGLEFLVQYNGKKYDQLPRDLQRRIRESQATVYTIEPGTPTEVKFNIFKRINTGGLPLSPQEIRHALFQGEATTLLEELANSSDFSTFISSKISDERMEARAIVLRCLAGYHGYTTSGKLSDSLDSSEFLNNTMEDINTKYSKEYIENMKKLFLASTRQVLSIFGKDSFRILLKRGTAALNRVMLEAFIVELMRNPQDNKIINKYKDAIRSKYSVLIQKTDRSIVYRNRFESIHKIFLEVAK